MSVGERIKNYRKKAKLTQEGLAKKTNLSRSYIADIERDRYNPSVETLRTISKALGVSVGALMDDEFEDLKNELDDDIRAIQRAKKNMSKKDWDRMMDIIKISFEDAFEEDDDDENDL